MDLAFTLDITWERSILKILIHVNFQVIIL